MFDLDTGVDLDKVVPALLVDEELASPGVSVIDGMSELESILEDTLSDRFFEMGCRGDLDDLARISNLLSQTRLTFWCLL